MGTTEWKSHFSQVAEATASPPPPASTPLHPHAPEHSSSNPQPPPGPDTYRLLHYLVQHIGYVHIGQTWVTNKIITFSSRVKDRMLAGTVF